MADRKKLLKTLEELKDEEFKKFKWHLQQQDILEGSSGIPSSSLEKADRPDTVDKIVQTYSHQCVEVVKKILEKINRNDLVEKLSNTSTGAHGFYTDEPPSKLLQIITSYQTKLRSNLQDPFKWIQEGWTTKKDEKNLDEIYTEPYVTEEGNTHISRQLRQIQMASGQSEEPQISNIFTHPSGKNIRTVLTNGDAGIGKTFLVHKFVLDWAEKRTNEDVHLIFPFTFSSLKSQKDKMQSFAQLIHSCIHETRYMKQEVLHNIFTTLQTSGNRNFDKSEYKLIFVFDGLDESIQLDFSANEQFDVTESTSVDVLLTNLIRGKLLPSARLWITTRPAAANQIPPECVDMVTEVRGFTDPQKEEYFRKRFRDEKQASTIISHIKTSRSLHIMCHMPVYCWITATVLEELLKSREGGELPKTLTEMYIHSLVVQMKRMTDQYGREKSIQYIKTLTKLAFKQLEKNNLMFCEKDLKVSSSKSNEDFQYSKVFSQIFREEHQTDGNKMFSFVHQSIVEFLAALHVVLSSINTNRNSPAMVYQTPLPEIHRTTIEKAIQSPNGHLDLFLRFLLGLSLQTNQKHLQGLLTQTGSSSQNIQLIVNYVKRKMRQNPSPDRSINLFHCLNELNDRSLVEEIQQSLRSGSLSTDKLSPAQWSALVFILSSEKDLDVFDLKKYSASEEAQRRLLEVVKASNKALTDNTTTEDIFSTSSLISSGSAAVGTDVDGNKEKQSVNISEEGNMEDQQTETIKLLSRLHLLDKYEQKLTPADFLKIVPPVKQHHDTSEKDLAHTFLQKLMMLDYRVRYIPVRRDRSEVTCDLEFNTEDDVLEAFFSPIIDSDQTEQSHVHPMDVQMAVFHCSDSFLKQMMITKLSQCQYAVPLLVPDPVTKEINCPLWTFRQIMKSWKKTQTIDDSNIITMKSLPVCKAKTLMVSFFRLGSPSVSKSQLMSTLINDLHSTFFHRNCTGSTKSRHLMDGVAEIAWYCPAGKPDDAFTDCVAFCNLHGDALIIDKQREILMEKSSVNVVLVQTLERRGSSATVISALLKSTKPVICLIVDDDCGAVKIKEGKYRMGLKDRSWSDVCGKLKGIIGKILSGPERSFQLETMTDVSGIRVDEDDSVCQRGKSAAMKIVNLLKGTDVSKIKDKYLPCQGKLWHDWSRIHKELYHLRGNIEMEKCKNRQEMERIRQQQRDASCSELIKLFSESLSSLPSEERKYFLKWIQIFLDVLSTGDLSSILQQYDQKWSEVLDLKKKHDKSDLLTKKQTELEEISAKLQSATFGLEHIFREMGQIYEAHETLLRQTKTDWCKYPERAAELMIAGHPMELMDGDAVHVPLTWISALLDEVKKKLGDPRVFVLSVLGLQSSGKSTMLNAMFGLQSAVSAGRCTKGAFMQLVKLSDEMKEEFQFDYVLVVDTEGLRALELADKATLHHDNELATFIVGLGNMTLINIFGENPADMQDILQIVVQAFMRMKKVKLSPSCVFVHQNVTDISAAEKNMDGKRRLQEKLDQMAKLAAKEEVCDAECFSDIITFDVKEDVKYFAQLWEGSPPMAPPNPGYSESIQELKNFILSKASQSKGTKLSQFSSNIKDLWNALIKENFVFSFKNTLEMAAYRTLEVQYENWTWKLRSNMLKIENQLHTKIENGKLDNVETSDLHKEMNKTYEEVKKDMKVYFDADRDKEMLVQWRGRFENKIKEFLDELIREVKRKLDEIIQQKKKACKQMDEKKTEFENKLLQKSKELAHQLKDKTKDEKELKRQFNTVWRGWISELTRDIKPIEDIKLEEEQFTILQELGIEQSLINESKTSSRYKKMSVIGDYSDYVIIKNSNLFSQAAETVKRYFRESLPSEEQNQIRSLIKDVEQQSLHAMMGKPVATKGHSPAYLQEVAKNVKEKVTEFESKREYVLKKEFTVDLLLSVFDKTGSWISESHRKFRMNNDAVNYLENKKMQHYNIFRSFCKGSSSVVVLGELICEKLKDSAVEAVCNKTAIDLTGEMRCRFPAFSGNRLDLEKHVLTSLAEKEDFDGFINYIRHPRNQTETFIREEVEKYIFREHKDEALRILKKNVEEINRLVSRALFTATEKVKTQRGDIDVWLKEFSSLLEDELTFDTICSQNFSDINDFDFLKEEIEKGLKSVIRELSSLSLDKMKEFRLKPDQILIDRLCNCCWVTCPFCAAVCTNTLEDHSPEDHSAPFHRPDGVNGFHYRDTVEMSIGFCTTRVASDGSFYPRNDSEETVPFKLYRTAGPRYANWRITPDESKLQYWKWFVCRFQTQLENHYKLKFQDRGEIPREWERYSKEEAIKSLDEMCQ